MISFLCMTRKIGFPKNTIDLLKVLAISASKVLIFQLAGSVNPRA